MDGMLDGDTVFVMATGPEQPLQGPALIPLGAASVAVLVAAIERSVRLATPLAGVPAAS